MPRITSATPRITVTMTEEHWIATLSALGYELQELGPSSLSSEAYTQIIIQTGISVDAIN